jgi:DNA-binding NarL/FixJ family response regulator
MDVQMKEMDGLTATRQLKIKHPEAHVVMMSQFRDPAIQKEAKLAGAEKFMLKENILEMRNNIGKRLR